MAAQAPVRVAVLGAGAWGTALAVLASARADTLLWARDEQLARQINDEHRNPRYLSDIALPASLRGTASFEQAIAHVCRPADEPGLIILGVPVAGLTETCVRLSEALKAVQPSRLGVVWTCKGFHPESGLLPHEIVHEALAQHTEPRQTGLGRGAIGRGAIGRAALGRAALGLGVLSGPSFAQEVARGLPVALTLASHESWVADPVLAALHGSSARIYTSADVVGVEVGGALKNIIAIACGISDGLGLGTNARAALITRGLAEMQRVGLALGGQAETFAGLTGLGDLVLTATGDLSRNRQVGLAIGRGSSRSQILASGVTAEGVRCARAVLALGRRHQLELPITEAVCKVLFEDLAPSEAVSDLLSREARPESHIPPA